MRLVWDLVLSWEAVLWYLVKVAVLVFFNRASVADLIHQITHQITRKFKWPVHYFCLELEQDPFATESVPPAQQKDLRLYFDG